MNHILELLEKVVKEKMNNKDMGNDYFHTELSIQTAHYICKKENADFDVVKAALLLHHISPRKKTDDKFNDYRAEGLSESEDILIKMGCSKEMIDKILNCIETTHLGQESRALSIESKIAFDANKLVTTGALAIARTFAFGGSFGRPIYDPENSLIKTKEDINSYKKINYDPYKIEVDSISHFITKLLKLKDKIMTKTGKDLVQKRHNFMIQFIEEFLEEIGIDSAK
jgi:uncharacterized protein